MSNFETLWPIHDSLAFYMSTTTFSNLAFEAFLADEPSLLTIRRASNPSSSIEEEQVEEQVVVEPKRGKEYQKDEELGKLKSIRKELVETVNNFCDNIGFSLRSKLFVLELSLKRKLRSLKRFIRARRSLQRIFVMKDDDKGLANRSSYTTSYPDEKWLYLLEQEPCSKESIILQKERILNRLEEVKRANLQRRLEEQEDSVLFNLADDVTNWSSSNQTICSKAKLSKSLNQPPEYTVSGKKFRDLRRHKKQTLARASKWKQAHGTSKYSQRASSGVGFGVEELAFQKEEEKLCIICFINLSNVVTLPCKHHEICSDCFVELIYKAVKHSQFPLNCVLCRQKVERVFCSRPWLMNVIESEPPPTPVHMPAHRC